MLIDFYAYNSKIKSWNAAFKVFLSIITLILTISISSFWVSLFVLFTMGVLTIAIGKTPLKVYLRLITIPLAFLILSCLMLGVEFHFKPQGDFTLNVCFFYICATKAGALKAVNVFFKSLAGVSALYMLSLSTPVNELVLVLQGLRLPSLICELMNLIYRYIFILLEAAEQMQIAAKARLGYTDFVTSCKSFAKIAGSLFIISLKKADAYYNALLARGYNGSLNFLTEQKPLKKWQLAGAAIYFSLIIAIGILANWR